MNLFRIGRRVLPVAALLAVMVPGAAAAHEPVPAHEPVAVQQPVAAHEPVAAAPLPAATGPQALRDTWARHGRPDRMVIVRRRHVDLVENGALTRRIPRRAVATVGLDTLTVFLPDRWLSIDDGVARLSAAVVMTAGTTLDVGGAVRTLALVGGAEPADAATIWSGSGRLDFHDVTVTSRSPDSPEPLPADARGRPFVVAEAGGRLDAVDTSFADLGAPAAAGPGPAVAYHRGSGGSLLRSAIVRGVVGLELAGSRDVGLDDVAVLGSAADGLVLRGDAGTSLREVRAERNGGNGVLITGPGRDRPLTGVAAQANGAFGIAVVGQRDPDVHTVSTSRNAQGGLRLTHTTGAAVAGVAMSDEPVGFLVNGTSTRLTGRGLVATGGDQAVVVTGGASDVDLAGVRVDGSATGIAVAGDAVRIRHSRLAATGVGLRISRGSTGVSATGLRVVDASTGIVVTPGAAGPLLADLSVSGAGEVAVRTSAPDTRILGARIEGGPLGFDLRAATTVSDSSVQLTDDGIRVSAADPVRIERTGVAAVAAGITVADGSRVQLVDSQVDALEALRGEVVQVGSNELSLPPLSVVGAIGGPLVVLAVALELLHARRQRRAFGPVVRMLPPSLSTST